jgi:hypothetical protein
LGGLPGVLGATGRRGDRHERRPGVPEQDLSGGRECDLACGSFQELDAEVAFQLTDRPGQRRLRHAQPLGRASEVEFLGDGDEIPELSDLQIIHIARVSIAIGSVLQVRGPAELTCRGRWLDIPEKDSLNGARISRSHLRHRGRPHRHRR